MAQDVWDATLMRANVMRTYWTPYSVERCVAFRRKQGADNDFSLLKVMRKTNCQLAENVQHFQTF